MGKKGLQTSPSHQLFSFQLSIASTEYTSGQDNGICTRRRPISQSLSTIINDPIIVIATSRWTSFSCGGFVPLEHSPWNKKSYRFCLNASAIANRIGKTGATQQNARYAIENYHSFCYTVARRYCIYRFIGTFFGLESTSGGGNAIDSDAWSTERISSANADRTRVLERSFVFYRDLLGSLVVGVKNQSCIILKVDKKNVSRVV